jgi:superfamily II DNA/RNA helicase
MPPTPAIPTFADLGLQPNLLRAAAAAGWVQPSAIQVAAIPAVLQGRDLLAQAPTGAGKTAAFLLPLLQRLLNLPGVADERPRALRALVLVPTRELAAQIAAAAHALAPQLKTVAVVGGLSINPQMQALRGGAHLLVATPGRLLDLTRQNAVHLRDLELLVLDEADRLLDADFADETQRVLALAPRQRQTLLFSATLPEAVQALAARVQRQALVLTANLAAPDAPALAVTAGGDAGTAAHARIAQRAIVVDTARRNTLLRHLLRTEAWPRALVFVATQHGAEHLADKLRQAGVAAAALHGDLSPGRRSQVLTDLQTGQLAVLVATDLASRGIDLVQLPVVVNFDLPRSATDYTHRIGRTGRAGAQGVAISFIAADAPGSEAHFRLIEKRQAQRVPREQVAGFEAAAPLPPLSADPHGGANGGVKGLRKSKKDKLREAAAVRALAPSG